jgi:hypothetical protein
MRFVPNLSWAEISGVYAAIPLWSAGAKLAAAAFEAQDQQSPHSKAAGLCGVILRGEAYTIKRGLTAALQKGSPIVQN